QLYSRRADGSGRAVDEDPASLPEICLLQTRQGVERSVADWRSLLEAHAGRHGRDSGAHPDRDELGVCPEPDPTTAEGPVTDRELADGRANGFDLSSKFGAEDPLLRPAEAKDQAAHKGEGEAATSVGFACRAVQAIHRRGVDLDEDL